MKRVVVVCDSNKHLLYKLQQELFTLRCAIIDQALTLSPQESELLLHLINAHTVPTIRDIGERLWRRRKLQSLETLRWRMGVVVVPPPTTNLSPHFPKTSPTKTCVPITSLLFLSMHKYFPGLFLPMQLFVIDPELQKMWTSYSQNSALRPFVPIFYMLCR